MIKKALALFMLCATLVAQAQIRIKVNEVPVGADKVHKGDSVTVYDVEPSADINKYISQFYIDKGGIYKYQVWTTPSKLGINEEQLAVLLSMTDEAKAQYRDSVYKELFSIIAKDNIAYMLVRDQNKEIKKLYPEFETMVKDLKHKEQDKQFKDGEYISFRKNTSYGEPFYMNSAGRIEPNFYIRNNSNKRIKYVHITMKFKNAVEDFVDWNGQYSVNVSATGPIEPYEENQYRWTLDFWNGTAKTMHFSSVKIIYMDGTQKVLPVSKVRFE